jgi:hypothetical protein
LGANPKWANPAERLPQANAIVSFSGILQKFDIFFAPGKKGTTCAVVALEDITYLYNPPPKPATNAVDPQQQKGSLRDKIRARAQTKRLSQSTSTPSSSQTLSQSSSSPSTSQTKLGKRKATSEDDVDEQV